MYGQTDYRHHEFSPGRLAWPYIPLEMGQHHCFLVSLEKETTWTANYRNLTDATCLISPSAAQSSLPAWVIMTPISASPLCFTLWQIYSLYPSHTALFVLDTISLWTCFWKVKANESSTGKFLSDKNKIYILTRVFRGQELNPQQ